MSRQKHLKLCLAASTAVALSACAGGLTDAPPAAPPPAWFEEARAASAEKGFPTLDDVPAEPRVAPASDPAWAALEADLEADRARLQADERASPAPANAQAQAEAFRDDAVRVIEDTRERY